MKDNQPAASPREAAQANSEAPRETGRGASHPAVTQSKAAQTLVQRAEAPAARPAPAAPKKPNTTGLPDQLKAGVESLSGHSLDEVRVHYNSSQPAQLQAHAFAQGSDIHVAPGQERHLPHEAWHVVQQQQGRVQPTRQLKAGVPVNDDAGLEHEAEVMGAKAAQLQATGGTQLQKENGPTPAVAQFSLIEERAGTEDVGAISDYVGKLSDAADKAHLFVLHVPTLGQYRDLDGHTEHWAELWEEYMAGTPSNLMAAAFGYAVESLVTWVYLPDPPAGMVAEPQGPRGNTRPDVILKKGTRDVAWLDITSEGSPGHIWDKAGWEDVDFHIAEIGYRPMDLVEFNPTPNYDDKVDMNAFRKRNFWLKRQKEIRRIVWKGLGNQFKRQGRGGIAILLERDLPPEIMGRLTTYFGVKLDAGKDDDRSTAASVLYAMGVNPRSWKIYNSQSKARGESFLTQYDPHLFHIEIPEDGVPQLISMSEEMQELLRLGQAAGLADEQAGLDEQTDETMALSEEAQSSSALVLAEAESRQTGTELAVEQQQHEQARPLQPLWEHTFRVANLEQLDFRVVQGLGQFLHQQGLALSVAIRGENFAAQTDVIPGNMLPATFGAWRQQLALELPQVEESSPKKRKAEFSPSFDDRPLRKTWYEAHALDLQIRIFADPSVPQLQASHQQEALQQVLALFATPLILPSSEDKI